MRKLGAVAATGVVLALGLAAWTRQPPPPAQGGGTVTGKVKFTLKKGTKPVKSITAKLKKGKASAAFKHVSAKGKYSIIGKYTGSASLKGSSGNKAKFKVK